MIGSPSIKEGVSLKAVSQVHIMEPSWNVSKLNQICGRGIRFCSHKDLKKSKRTVEVYLYLATYQGIKTIDQHIWSNAKKKAVIINEFELSLKENAIDCELFYNRNNYASDNIQLKCYN
jgi:transposase